ncbi:hypothetical protein [Arenibacter sp. ARW7G5Y1]|uniref:hypothetical protein n=1 Tax=Arenibacter sp. ARW7G5Y1 TaxID=2135619 RepID=UPI000D75319D|nr:hypothetical protein [Arenibacter sp. ARW7G5Y1]PXX31698.1 hypothetical protein C7972_101537 [Arenibacter sp. ARW7G5Y1]|tara:strand:- start:26518 stop:26721 length:204 start_codon:yes stop_codon:yes gene_type:complete
MIKILRYTEYLYLAVAVVSIFEIYEQWNIDRQRAYLFVFFAIVSIGMFIFKKTYRKRFEERQKNNKQ